MRAIYYWAAILLIAAAPQVWAQEDVRRRRRRGPVAVAVVAGGGGRGHPRVPRTRTGARRGGRQKGRAHLQTELRRLATARTPAARRDPTSSARWSFSTMRRARRSGR